MFMSVCNPILNKEGKKKKVSEYLIDILSNHCNYNIFLYFIFANLLFGLNKLFCHCFIFRTVNR